MNNVWRWYDIFNIELTIFDDWFSFNFCCKLILWQKKGLHPFIFYWVINTNKMQSNNRTKKKSACLFRKLNNTILCQLCDKLITIFYISYCRNIFRLKSGVFKLEKYLFKSYNYKYTLGLRKINIIVLILALKLQNNKLYLNCRIIR